MIKNSRFIKRAFTLVLLFTLFVSMIAPSFAYASDLNVIKFKDKNLENVIRKTLGIEEGDITKEDMSKLNYLNAEQSDIKDISGLEYAKNLVRVYLRDNSITDITPLSTLTGINYLDVSGNKLVKVPDLSALSNLRYLNLSQNKIIDISPITNVSSLEFINLNFNSIKKIPDVSMLTKVSELKLSMNQIEEISSLQSLTSLKYLQLISNQLDDVSVLKELPKLESVELGGNNIEDISVFKSINHPMTGLYLSENDITDISPIVSFAKKGYLKNGKLDLVFNQLDLTSRYTEASKDIQALIDMNINVSYDPQLPSVDEESSVVYGKVFLNSLEGDLNPSENATIVVYDEEKNIVREITTNAAGAFVIDGLEEGDYSLKVMYSGYVEAFKRFSTTNGQMQNIKIWLLPTVVIGTVFDKDTAKPVDSFEVDITGDEYVKNVTGEGGAFGIKEVPIGTYTITIVAKGYKPLSQQINIENIKVLDFKLEPVTEEETTLEDNTELRLKINKQLVILKKQPYISNNIPMVPINDIFEKLEFNMEKKGLSYTATKGSVKIEYKVLQNKVKINDTELVLENKVTITEGVVMAPIDILYQLEDYITVEWDPALRTISISDSLYVTIPDPAFDAYIHDLLGLNLDVRLTTEDMEQLTDIDILGEEDIKDLTGLEYAINLESFQAGYVKEIDLAPLKNLTNLSNLTIYSTKLKNVKAIENLTNLTSLELVEVGLKDISFVQNLENLKYLTLSSNKIIDISPLEKLTALEELYLDDNKIKDIAVLSNLTNLKILYTNHNQINDYSPLRNLENIIMFLGDSNYLENLSDLPPQIEIRGRIYFGEVDKVKKILEDGFDPNKEYSIGETPLAFAAYHGNAEIVELLIDYGADINFVNSEKQLSILDYAILGKKEEIFDLLLEKGIKLNNTEIFNAVLMSSSSMTEKLLNYGANPNEKFPKEGTTPLMIASYYGLTDMVELLLENGGDPTIRDSYGNTAVEYATAAGYDEIVKLLKSYITEK